MKKIEITVVNADSDEVKKVLKETGLQYRLERVRIEGKPTWLFSALVPDEIVDEVIENVSESIDLRIKENTLSTYSVEAQVSSFVDRLKKKTEKETPHNPLEQILNATDRYTRLDSDLILMVFFASIIALAGLFLDNVALVIGGMLVSPLLGPINAFSVNANLGRLKKIGTSQLSIVILLLSVMFLSALITLIVSQFATVNTNTAQILIRQHASLTDVGIGVVLGFAGGLALFIAIPEILVGVSIAVALLPPAAVAGIALARLDYESFLGALLLTLVYLVALELGSTLILRLRGITPRGYFKKAESRRRFIYSILVLASLLIALAVIIYFT